ncbi:MAG TPA: class I SAM-dependent methyltransferase [Pyrinomonadaceae bacterium]|jgi:2-polyprenyl-3-methyl-5-hydroxy-6-metoxy-1,4-benzoquinol methylase
MNTERVRNDFDEIARLTDCHVGGGERYDSFLLSLVPRDAVSILDIGCGLGRLATKLATHNRQVTGVDLSPEMIAGAQKESRGDQNLTFLCGDFLDKNLTKQQFDFVISAAVLHHVPANVAVPRMVELLRPGGRLVIHDVRSNTGLAEQIMGNFALAQVLALRLWRTGRVLYPRPLREAWARHTAEETYLTQPEAKALATRLLPGARVFHHWLWSYTIVWDKPREV